MKDRKKGRRVGKSADKARKESVGVEVAVDQRVRVWGGTDDEVCGVVVDDFGDLAGQSVDMGDNHIADAARRWAVLLDNGSLVFVDDADIAVE